MVSHVHRTVNLAWVAFRFALEMELINCQGKTPDATMASALYTDVKRKLHTSVFTRPQVILVIIDSFSIRPSGRLHN